MIEKQDKSGMSKIFVFFAALTVFYFLDYFLTGKTLLSVNINSDFLGNDYPLTYTAISLFKKGIFPLWNPFVLCGTPFFASSIAVLSIFSLPQFLLPMPVSYMICLMLEVFCSGLFMFYYLSKGLKLSPSASLLGGGVYMFSPLFLIMLPHYGADAPALLFLPLIVLLFALSLEKMSALYALFTALILAVSLYSDTGYQYIYISLFLLLYTLLCSRKNDVLRNFYLLFIAIAVSFLLSAARIFPAIEELGLSHRGGDHLQEGLFISNLIGAVFPFGPIRIGQVEVGTLKNAYLYYAGVITVLLAFIAVTLAIKDRFARIFSCLLAGLIIFLVLLRYTPLKLELFRVFPILGTLALERFNFFYHFIMVSLAAIGYGAVEKNMVSKGILSLTQRIIKWLIIGYSAALIIFVFFWIFKDALRGYWMNVSSGMFNRYHMGKFTYLYEQLFLPTFLSLVAFSISVRVAILYILSRILKGARTAVFIFVFLAALDLILAARVFLNPFSYDYYRIYETDSREEDFLKTVKPTERIGIKINYYEPDFKRTGLSVAYAQENPDIGPYNLGLNYNIPIVFAAKLAGGCDAMYPKRLREFVALAHKNDNNYDSRSKMQAAKHVVEFTSVDSNLIDLMGMKYVFSIRPLSGNKLKLLFKGADYYVYENTKVLARAFFVDNQKIALDKDDALRILGSPDFDPAREVILEEPVVPSINQVKSGKADAGIVSYQPNKVVISGHSDTDTVLLLTDTYYPGWKAFVDSKAVKIYQADYIFRAVVFPKGRHVVEFIYSPFTFRLGAAISLTTLLAVFIFIIYKSGKHKYAWKN